MTGMCKSCGELAAKLNKDGICETCWHVQQGQEVEEDSILEAYDNDRL
jgi:hypothetical protein